MANTDRYAETDRTNRLSQLEAEDRAQEARLTYFRNTVRRQGKDSPLVGRLSEMEADFQARREEMQELRDMGPIKDPEGTAPGLSDIAGNFAPNQEVANAGGTGVQASNSTADGAQAQTAMEALDGAQVIRPPGFQEPTIATLNGQKAVEALQGGGDAAAAVDDDEDEDEEDTTTRRRRGGARKARRSRKAAAESEEE